jgi:predicted GIY-YIG superfamily endonuclease
MEKYKNSKIYKLVSKDLSHDLIYIGYTTQDIKKRLNKHKSDYNRYCKKTYHWVTAFELFNRGAVDIVLLEEISANDKYELKKRQRHYIETSICVNKVIPTCTTLEYSRSKIRKEYIKEKKNLKVSCECGILCDRINLLKHQKTSIHKMLINSINDKIEKGFLKKCECGILVTKYHLEKHMKTKKHMDTMEKNKNL